MTRLLATLALLAFLAPALAEPQFKRVTDPELLRILNAEDGEAQSSHPALDYLASQPPVTDRIDLDAYHNCMLKYVGQAQTDTAVSAIRQACRHKTRR